MKKLIISILLSFFLLSGSSWAQEASYFDSRYGWIVRAYLDSDSKPWIEVRNTLNQIVGNVLINDQTSNPYKIADLSSSSISLAFDEVSGKAYVFYTASNSLQLASLTISSPLGNISATPSSLNFGTVSVGQSATQTVTIRATGGQVTLGNIQISGNSFSRNGGTCQSDSTLSSNGSCTIGVKFTPSSANNFSGTLSIQSNANTLTVPLSGTGSAGNVDLTITSLSAPKGADNNKPFTISVTIKNQGSDSAGQFTVRAYFSRDTIPGNEDDQLLHTWPVNSLGGGASETLSAQVTFKNFPIHAYYYIVVKVDADNDITESNENNNIATQMVFVSR